VLGFGRALSLVEIPVDEDALEHYERQRRDELRQVGQQVRELRELQEYANTLVAEHGMELEHAVEEADIALDNATSSRVQLTLAAKYKIAGAALTGALVGGLLGGPLGLIAGAKSATTIGLVALAGGATGSVVGSTVASTTAARSAAVDEDYQIRREKDHLHAQ
jgi:syntaxin 17